ncbi:hypothetical protein Shyhy02_29800 [Streptomyces hygroscopicus subsp. hygroscopicus]|nr:hypothetical protein Shyhy02_29800 [Streptomyces hygroscopicus subsp. hygroscopicus]
MDAIGPTQALRILEAHTRVPRDEVQRDEVFAAFSWLRLMAMGGDEGGVTHGATD